MPVNKFGKFIVQRGELSKSVVTCAEAAAAKGIPLKNELKSLILQTSNGIIALHTPGNESASLRAIKNHLRVKEAHLASKPILAQLKLSPGEICPFLYPVLEMPHLISGELMNNEFLSTNDGTKTGYLLFPPSELLKLENKAFGDFSKK